MLYIGHNLVKTCEIETSEYVMFSYYIFSVSLSVLSRQSFLQRSSSTACTYLLQTIFVWRLETFSCIHEMLNKSKTCLLVCISHIQDISVFAKLLIANWGWPWPVARWRSGASRLAAAARYSRVASKRHCLASSRRLSGTSVFMHTVHNLR